MRTHYSIYTQHCMRFYTRYPSPIFGSEADEKDWKACEDALKDFSPYQVDILTTVYRENDTLMNNIRKVSIARNIDQDKIWKLVSELEKRIAEKRGLL